MTGDGGRRTRDWGRRTDGDDAVYDVGIILRRLEADDITGSHRSITVWLDPEDVRLVQGRIHAGPGIDDPTATVDYD